jgi:hypothetical protein
MAVMANPEAAERVASPAESIPPERRAFPRHKIDASIDISLTTGAIALHGHLIDLSMGGCRLATVQAYQLNIMVRVEVQFQLRGIVFRFVGVTAGTRPNKSFAVRFLDMPMRRKAQLAEVLAEVAAANAAAELEALANPEQALQAPTE